MKLRLRLPDAFERSLRLKLSTELWDFSDPGADGRHNAVSMHLGVVGTF